MKIVVVGGGSVYTPELARGFVLLKDRLPVDELVLVDIPEGRHRTEAVSGLLGRMFQAAGMDVRLETTEDRRTAIRGASFVLNQFRVGGLRARSLDERIPMKYGIPGQETTGPGGFAMGLRTIPVALDVARDVRDLAPGAWVLNFSNPAGMVTEALLHHVPEVSCLGLCNIPLIFQRTVAQALGLPPEEVRLRVIGLNHLSWAQVYVKDEDVTPAILRSEAGQSALVANIPGLDPSDPALRRLGALAGRLGRLPNPYLRYFVLPRAMLAEAEEGVRAGRGTRADEVMRVERILLDRYRDPGLTEPPDELARRGGAWYADAALMVMDALTNGGTLDQVVNVPNRGATPDMPDGAVLELNASIGPDGVRPVPHGPLPPEMRGLMQAVKAYEELTISAAVTGDRTVALQALLSHPMVPDLPTAAALLDDLLEAHRAHLPAFFPGDHPS